MLVLFLVDSLSASLARLIIWIVGAVVITAFGATASGGGASRQPNVVIYACNERNHAPSSAPNDAGPSRTLAARVTQGVTTYNDIRLLHLGIACCLRRSLSLRKTLWTCKLSLLWRQSSSPSTMPGQAPRCRRHYSGNRPKVELVNTSKYYIFSIYPFMSVPADSAATMQRYRHQSTGILPGPLPYRTPRPGACGFLYSLFYGILYFLFYVKKKSEMCIPYVLLRAVASWCFVSLEVLESLRTAVNSLPFYVTSENHLSFYWYEIEKNMAYPSSLYSNRCSVCFVSFLSASLGDARWRQRRGRRQGFPRQTHKPR